MGVKISVIMAEHNTRLKDLQKSIQSILNQTYKDFELIVVNDCTNNENRDYLYQIMKTDSRVKIIDNNKNLGLAGSLNKAIENSNGNFIFRMDTDDISIDYRLSRQLSLLESGHKIITGRALIIDKEDNIVSKTKYFPFYNMIKNILLYFFYDNGAIHPLVAAHREVFDLYKYDESIEYGQDFELWLRMSRDYKMYFDKEILLKYRVSGNKNLKKATYQYIIHKNVIEKHSRKRDLKNILSRMTLYKIRRKIYSSYNISRQEFMKYIGEINEVS